jgi:hypothetical protein
MNQAVEAWLSLNQFDPQPEAPHECAAGKCFFLELDVFACAQSTVCLGGGTPAVMRGGRPARAKAPCHGAAHTLFVGAKARACADTGIVHACGKDCERASISDEGLRVCDLTRAVLADLRGAAHLGWLRTNEAEFAMTAVHECSPDCLFEALEVYTCPVFGTCIGGGAFPLVVRDSARRRCLVPAKNRCFGARGHRHLSEAKVFACMETGRAHLCGRTCDRTSETHEGDAVCEYTGRVLRATVVARPVPLPAGCVFRDTSDFKTEYVRSSPGGMDLARYYGHLTTGIRHKAGEQVREQVFNALLGFTCQYISERANRTNPERNACGDKAARDAIEDQCARRSAAPPSFLALAHAAAAVRSGQPLSVALKMSAPQARKHAGSVAIRIVALMGALRHLVPGGRNFVDGMSLKTFFLLGIEMCRQGLVVAHTTLLTPDPILVLLSRGDTDAASFWKDAVDGRSAPRNLAKMPAQLRRLIDAAVAERRVGPERLRLDEITDHLQVATEGFEGYRKKKE